MLAASKSMLAHVLFVDSTSCCYDYANPNSSFGALFVHSFFVSRSFRPIKSRHSLISSPLSRRINSVPRQSKCRTPRFPLMPIMLNGTLIRSWGFTTRLNTDSQLLELDSSVSSTVLDEKQAAKAGV